MSEIDPVDATDDAPAPDAGFVLIYMVIVVVLLLSVAAFAVDLVHAYAQGQKLQNAVDAAALGGAVELPRTLTDAQARARVMSLLSNNLTPDEMANITVLVNQQDTNVPNQMDVEVKLKVDTYFARVMGFDSLTVRRSANAQYDPPVAMGSPANNLGDVPVCPPLSGNTVIPPASCLSVPSNSPQKLFASIQGEGAYKEQGNAMTHTQCDNPTNPTRVNVDGCVAGPGGANTEYDGGGESFLVKNENGAALDLWIYDPGFVRTGPKCEPNDVFGNAYDAGWNDGIHNMLDAHDVFNHFGDPAFCAGDSVPQASGQSGPALDTTFDVVDPDGNPVAGCTTTFPGFDEDPGFDWHAPAAGIEGAPQKAHDAGPGNPTYEGFHQWYKLCTLPGRVTTDGHEFRVHVKTGNGAFTNQFSFLALSGSSSNGYSVFTRQKLPIVAVDVNSSAAKEFYLARVLPSSKDRVLEVDFFDLGDSSLADPDGVFRASGDLSLKTSGVAASFSGFGFGNALCSAVPVPANGDPPQPPPPFDESLFTPPDPGGACSWHYDARHPTNTWNGRWVALKIHIPSANLANGWKCDQSSFQNCWVKLVMDPDGMNVSDATTWSATIRGAPVRLVK